MLRIRALLIFSLAQLLGYGCGVPLDAETKLFSCSDDSDCLSGFVCKAIIGAENEAIAGANVCQQCSVKSLSIPQFQPHPSCLKPSSQLVETLDCDLLPGQDIASAVHVSGQWFGRYGVNTTATGRQLTIDSEINPWRPGELITVSNTSLIKTLSDDDDQTTIRPFVSQFRVPVQNGRAEFVREEGDTSLPDSFFTGVSGQADAQLADLDKDGDLDIVSATSIGSDSVSIWLNDSLSSTSLALRRDARLKSRDANPTTRHILLGDLNSDGSIDILAVNETANNEIWFNNGQGQFNESLALPKVASTEKHTNAALGDLDGDGDLDIVAIDSAGNGNTSVWLQDRGQFSPTSQSLRDGLDAAIGDLDGDGDLDVVIATESKGVTIWINQGNGTFFDLNKKIDVKTTINAITLGDLDGDSDLDIVLGKDGPNQVWVNDGISNFSLVEAQDVLDDAATQEVILADFNADNALDILFANSNRGNSIWINDGDAHFTRSRNLIGIDNTPSAAVGDINNNGTLDVILVQPEGNDIFGNSSKEQNRNTFNVDSSTLRRNVSIDMQGDILVSFDRPIQDFMALTPDQPLDPLFLSVRGQARGLYPVKGNCVDVANCTTVKIEPPPKGYQPGETLTVTATSKITSVEDAKPLLSWTWQLTVKALTVVLPVDDQGAADISGLEFSVRNDLFIYSPEDDISPEAQAAEVFIYGALGDIDQDSDIDIVVATDLGRVILWENQVCVPSIPASEDPDCGNPLVFKQSLQRLSEDDYRSNSESKARGVALADLNNDHRLDLFVFFDGLDRVWWQQDTSTITDSPETKRFVKGQYLSDASDTDTLDFERIGASRTVDAILADFNQDGLVDIYVANDKQSNTLWINSINQSLAGTTPIVGADHSFINTKQNFASDGTFSVAAGDLDNDGSLDIYVANAAGDNVWYNNRDSTLTSCNEARSISVTTKVALGNFTEDDDLAGIFGTVDVYLAQASNDTFFTIDPSTNQFSSERVINNSGTIATPDALLVDIFDVSSSSPSEATSALEVLTMNETNLDVLKLKFSDENKNLGDYVFQRSYTIKDIPVGCVQKILSADFNQDKKLDFALFNKRGSKCSNKTLVLNSSR
jgi:hypothetical protein